MPDVMPTVGDHVQSSPKSLAYETVAAARRTVVVAARVTRAEQAAFGEARAHRHPNAVERGHEVVSGTGGRWLDPFVRREERAAVGGVAGRRPTPAAGGFGAFPQGSVAPQARAASDPRQVAEGVA